MFQPRVHANQLNETVDSGQLETIGDWWFLPIRLRTARTYCRTAARSCVDRAKKTLAKKRLTAPSNIGECFGSVLGIQRHADRFLVTTHINPSASCTLVLDDRLRWITR